MRRPMRVGAAKLCISPDPEMFPLKSAGGLYEAVREGEDLHVRAIVVDNGEFLYLFETWELVEIPFEPALHEEIGRRYGIAYRHMMLTGPHNHSAYAVPGVCRDPSKLGSTGEPLDRLHKRLWDASLEVIGKAIESLRPARYGFGTGKSYINVNRDKLFDEGFEGPGYWMQGENHEGLSDKTVSLLKFEDEEGRLIAAVATYGMHSTTSYDTLDTDGKRKITCDIPGIASSFVEAYYGDDAVVLWQTGPQGDQNPGYIGIMTAYDRWGYMRERRRLPGAAYEQAVVYGQQHGMDIIRALRGIPAEKRTMRIRTTDRMVELEGQTYPEGTDRWYHRLTVDNLLEWAGLIGPDDLQPEKHLVDMVPTGKPVPMREHLTLFDDVAYLATSAELYSGLAKLCSEAAPFRKLVHVSVAGYPMVSYVMDDASKDHRVFQSFSMVRPGDSNRRVLGGMQSMFDELLYTDPKE